MYGAVLWADRCSNRALIWCEDHGELAFFEGEPSDSTKASKFEEGDFVAFKIRDGRGMRLAFEVEVVATEEYPCLAADLRCATSDSDPGYAAAQDSKERKVLPFPVQPGMDVRTAAQPQQPSARLGKVNLSR